MTKPARQQGVQVNGPVTERRDSDRAQPLAGNCAKWIFFLFCLPAFAQDPPLPAEARIKALVESGDTAGLGAYSLEIVAAYRALKALSAQQDLLITELKADSAAWKAGLAEIRVSLEAERVARDKMADRLARLDQPRWQQVLGGTATGVSVGAGVGRDSKSALIGGGIGTFLQWLITRKAKTVTP